MQKTELVQKDIQAVVITIYDIFKKLEDRLIMLNIDMGERKPISNFQR